MNSLFVSFCFFKDTIEKAGQKKEEVCDVYHEEQPHFCANGNRECSPDGQLPIHGPIFHRVGSERSRMEYVLVKLKG